MYLARRLFYYSQELRSSTFKHDLVHIIYFLESIVRFLPYRSSIHNLLIPRKVMEESVKVDLENT